ncbi:MAG: SCO family protein [Planctomycetota bacterium]
MAPPATEIGLDQHLDEQVPLHLEFRDEAGAPVTLERYFHDRPVVLALVYYECPMLCTLVLNGLTRALNTLSFTAGREFQVVVVSIDPRDTPARARDKHRQYVSAYGRAGAESGWHFLTGAEPAIAKLAASVGFRYRYDASSGQFAHASGIMVLTPQAGFRATSMASSTMRAICGWDWSRPHAARSDRSWSRCCCSASTTIRPPASTVSPS